MDNLAVNEGYEDRVKNLVPVSGLAAHYQNQVVASAEYVDVGRGQIIFREGDSDNFSYYILDGELELTAHDQLVKRVDGSSEDARHPLAQLQPRQMTATARRRSVIVRIDRGLLEKFLAIDTGSTTKSVEVEVLENDSELDWMGRMLQGELFNRIPAANIQQVFARLDSIEYKKGDRVVEQGEKGKFYYILQEGRCQVQRRAGGKGKPIKLATLAPGDTFGEEALVSNATRNASVVMVTDGIVGRLTKRDFVELIRDPLVTGLTLEASMVRVSAGATWVDVRFPEEFKRNGMDGATNIPLNTVRMHAEKLSAGDQFVCYCDSGSRGQVAAFLLSERGIDASFLVGGLQKYGLSNAPEVTEPKSDKKPKASTPSRVENALTIETDDVIDDSNVVNLPRSVSAPVPASMLSDEELSERGISASQAGLDATEADVRAQMLKAELEKANLQLDEARRLKEEAESARDATLKETNEDIEHERKALAEEATKAKSLWEEAQRMKLELEEKQQAAEDEAERRHREHEEELKKLQADAEKRLQEEEERLKASYAEQAEQMEKIREMREQAEADAARQQRQMEDELARRQADAQARIDEEQQRLQESLAEQAAELERVESIKAKAQEEMARRREEEESHLAELRAKSEEERAELERARNDEQQRILQMKEEAAREIEAERARMKEQLEREAERELAEQRAKIQADLESQAAELERIRKEKLEAEQELEKNREKVEGEAKDARARIAEAKKVQEEIELARRDAEREAEIRRQRQEELEQKLQKETEQKIAEERRKLELEFARNAEELERAKNEREAAERAKQAAANEAERIVAEYRESYEKVRAQEEQRMRLERERLEHQARRLQSELEEARILREQALSAQAQAEQKQTNLNIISEVTKLETGTIGEDIRDNIVAVEQQLADARQQLEDAEQAQKAANKAIKDHDVDIKRHHADEVAQRARFETEIQDWLHEQEAEQNTDAQRHLLANQRAHLERIKQRAQAAREAAKQHDQALVEELAARLKRPD